MERRFYEFRIAAAAPSADKPAQLAGYAAVFNSNSQDLGGFVERVAPGAFKDALASGGDIRCLVNHDPNKLMGRTSSKTLRLSEDENGLQIENDAPDTSYARDLLALVNRGDLGGMSFGFIVPKGGDEWGKTEDGRALRTLNKVDLREVTFTDNPAYLATSVQARAMVDPEAAEAAKKILEPSRLIQARLTLRRIMIT